MKVPVTERAVVGRLRRLLRPKGQDVRIADDRKQESGLGRYYLVGNQGLIDQDVDLEKLARSLGALRPWERLE
jgi:hypothetical protein